MYIYEFVNNKHVVLTTLRYIGNTSYMNKWCTYKRWRWFSRKGEGESTNSHQFLFSKQVFIWNLHIENLFWTVLKFIVKFDIKNLAKRYDALHLPPRFKIKILGHAIFYTIESTSNENIFNYRNKLHAEQRVKSKKKIVIFFSQLQQKKFRHHI